MLSHRERLLCRRRLLPVRPNLLLGWWMLSFYVELRSRTQRLLSQDCRHVWYRRLLPGRFAMLQRRRHGLCGHRLVLRDRLL